jgi:hypothetical protein
MEIKCIVILNLLTINIIFTILSFKKKNELMYFKIFITNYRKECGIIKSMFRKIIFIKI